MIRWNRLVMLVEYKFIPFWFLGCLVLLGAVVNFDYYYLLNDEIIFDFVLFSLVVYVARLISFTNYLPSLLRQEKSIQLSIFIQYYLVTYRYLLLRKKKLFNLHLISILDKLIHSSSSLFANYSTVSNSNISTSIQDRYLYKLRTILQMKRYNIANVMKDSYKSNLFILI